MDIALGPFAIELRRHEVIEFSGYVGGAGSSILVRYPASIYISSYATVEPFNYQVVFGLNLKFSVAFFVFFKTWNFILFLNRFGLALYWHLL